jgi:hypothetical protein
VVFPGALRGAEARQCSTAQLPAAQTLMNAFLGNNQGKMRTFPEHEVPTAFLRNFA